MVRTFTDSASVVLGLVFVVAGISKLARPASFHTTLLLANLVPPRLVTATRAGVPALELCAGALLVSGMLHPAGPALALALLIAFTVRTWPVVARPQASGVIRCSCLGLTGERLDAGLVARNVVLAGYAVASAAGTLSPPYPLPATSIPASAAAILGLALAPFVLAEAVGMWRAAAHLPDLASLRGFAPEQAGAVDRDTRVSVP